MIYPKYARRRLIYYLIPVIIGLGGIAFSRQLDNLALRMIVVLGSVAVPLFAGGNLLARFSGGRYERLFLWVGMMLLLGGAAFGVSGIGDNLISTGVDRLFLVDASRWIGIFSLSLGLFVVLFSVVRAGEDIEEVAERFWHLAERITEGFILSTNQGTIFLVNKQFLEMTDLKEDEVIGQNAVELAQRLNVLPMQEHLERRKKGEASEYEVTWRVRGEERRLWFSGTPIRDEHGRHTANLATVRDVTEFHRLSQRVERYAESLKGLVEEQSKKLVQSEERFRQLLLSMNEGFLTIDTSNQIRFANPRFCQLLQLPEAELVGRDIFDFIAPATRVRMLNLLAKSSAADPAENRQELRMLTAGNEELPVLAGVSYLREAGAGEAVYSLVVTNVGDLVAMQRELAERADELERANEELLLHDRAKDSFLSNVSHELRTPLSTVQGYIEMLESGTLGEPHATQRNAFKVMQRNIERLLLLINEMIDFSRMEIRGVTLQPNLFLPSRLVQEGVASFVPQANAKGITLTFEDESAGCSAWGDHERLAQVLGILINNALKFSSAGGSVRVRAGRTDSSSLYFSIADTGIGVEPAFQEKIFDKFFQVDSSKSRRYEGAGIGLSIAKSIIEAHGGNIRLLSAVGQGSTFTVLLPGCVFEVEDRCEATLDASIIVVDELGVLAEGVTQCLAGSSARVRRVTGGAHCLREVEEEQPDVIFINDSPEDIAGEVSIGLLKRDPRTYAIPVLTATAEPPSRYAELLERWPGLYYMRKPFTPSVLADELGQILGAEHADGVESIHSPREISDPDRAKVLIIDSDPGLLEWVETALSNRNVLCYCAATLPAAMRMLEKDLPNVLFVDVDAPGAHSLDQVAALCHAPGVEGTPVYVMTGTREALEISNGIRGVLRKPFAIGEMLSLVPRRPPADLE